MRSSWQIILIAVSIIIPLLLRGNAFLTFIFTLIIINCILASDWNLLAGYLGLDNFAIGGLVGLGSYMSAYLTMKTGLSFWAAMPIAGVTVAAAGALLAFPALRMRGLYFGIFTLMVQIVLTQLFTDWTGFTGGDIGISSIPPPFLSLGSFSLVFTGTPFAYLCVIIFIVWIYVNGYFVSNDRGLRLICIRDDEVLASHLGINVVREKTVIFALTGFVAGIVGALMAELTTFISPRTTDIFLTIQVFAMVYIGGKGTLAGPIIGAILITALPNLFVTYYPYRNYVTGILIVVTYMFLPQGLVSITKVIRTHTSSKKGAVPQPDVKA